MIAGVLLAAGESRRMGSQKLLLPLRGKPLVRWAGEALVEAGLDPLIVVLGAAAAGVRSVLQDLPCTFVENEAYGTGMASSVSAGVRCVPPGCRAVALALGDMPLVDSQTIRQVFDSFRKEGKGIALPTHGGRRGHPVIFALPKYRSELLALTGDAGGRSLLATHPEDVLEVPVENAGVLSDVDTPEAYERVRDAAPLQPH